MKPYVFAITCLFIFSSRAADKKQVLTGPDKQLSVTVELVNGRPCYSISRNGAPVLLRSKLGIIRDDGDFSQRMVQLPSSPVTSVSDHYELLTIKRRMNSYLAKKQVFHFKNAAGIPMDLIFQVSADGVAFRYYFPGKAGTLKKISEELTTFNFGTKTTGWLQPMADAKSGWARANPSYEEYYQQEIAAGTPSPIKAGWVFPALFHTGQNWALLTESFPDGNYCGSRLQAASPGGEYALGFPQPEESFPGGPVYPQSALPWSTPWRIICIGSLKTITESTLATSLAKPAVKMDASFVKPGKSSWSWVLLKDDSTVYSVQKRFIDYAADMHWDYCLIDAGWDKQIGYEQIASLAAYAATKHIGVLLWYNSAGSWNTTPQTPRSKLLTHDDRLKEFAILKQMGIKGVKVDFFGGDGQSMMNYYTAILEDAAAFQLMVNFHGATLPRGLERTYPNLVSMEAIKGMEFATFAQENEDEQPVHCSTIPFVRNVFDPMDYTPMALYKMGGKIKRKTTSAFELALPVLFTSGIQHLAETPQGMTHVPAYVKDFLRTLPGNWDDVRFIDGFPGKFAVMARRSGKRWVIAGINGGTESKQLNLDLSFLSNHKTGKMITDGEQDLSFAESVVVPGKSTKVTLKPAGGFVMVFE